MIIKGLCKFQLMIKVVLLTKKNITSKEKKMSAHMDTVSAFEMMCMCVSLMFMFISIITFTTHSTCLVHV